MLEHTDMEANTREASIMALVAQGLQCEVKKFPNSCIKPYCREIRGEEEEEKPARWSEMMSARAYST